MFGDNHLQICKCKFSKYLRNFKGLADIKCFICLKGGWGCCKVVSDIIYAVGGKGKLLWVLEPDGSDRSDESDRSDGSDRSDN